MKSNQIGSIGESIATQFLIKKGFKLLARNYKMKFGEIDIIVEREGIVHFVEVKSVTREIKTTVSREIEDHAPEDNVHSKKLSRISRTGEYYMNSLGDKRECQIDVMAVFIDTKQRKARCRFTENVL